VLLFACQALAGEQSALACITVYWHGEGSDEHASWNGARLREGHCAVDPKKIPYGSKVVFVDAECIAVDSGLGVINRKAARSCGRNVAERNAIVIDRFFDTKQKALAWARAHPRFMTVRILTPALSRMSYEPGSHDAVIRGSMSGRTLWNTYSLTQVQR
jgi:3D (Asp-Asp-Asp) domain-containing protein